MRRTRSSATNAEFTPLHGWKYHRRPPHPVSTSGLVHQPGASAGRAPNQRRAFTCSAGLSGMTRTRLSKSLGGRVCRPQSRCRQDRVRPPLPRSSTGHLWWRCSIDLAFPGTLIHRANDIDPDLAAPQSRSEAAQEICSAVTGEQEPETTDDPVCGSCQRDLQSTGSFGQPGHRVLPVGKSAHILSLAIRWRTGYALPGFPRSTAPLRSSDCVHPGCRWRYQNPFPSVTFTLPARIAPYACRANRC